MKELSEKAVQKKAAEILNNVEEARRLLEQARDLSAELGLEFKVPEELTTIKTEPVWDDSGCSDGYGWDDSGCAVG